MLPNHGGGNQKDRSQSKIDMVENIQKQRIFGKTASIEYVIEEQIEQRQPGSQQTRRGRFPDKADKIIVACSINGIVIEDVQQDKKNDFQSPAYFRSNGGVDLVQLPKKPG